MRRYIILLLVVLAASAGGCKKAQAGEAKVMKAPRSVLTDATSAKRLKKNCGIEVTSLRLTAGGDLAEMRYWVTDLKTAKKAFNQNVLLMEAESAKKFAVPTAGRIGALRQRPTALNHSHYVLFQTHGKLTQGSKAVLIIGKDKFGDLVVQ